MLAGQAQMQKDGLSPIKLRSPRQKVKNRMDIHRLEAGKPSVMKMNYVRLPQYKKFVENPDSKRAVFKV